MPQFDASKAKCSVFTFKEGLFSAVAHDLKLEVKRFEVDADATHVTARFQADSVKVVCAMKDGQPSDALSAKDASEIEATIAREVLGASAFPTITFATSAVQKAGDGYELTGTLTLKGKSRSLTFAAKRVGDELVASVQIRQPDFGIKPFSAMLGALKIKPEITVEVRLPASLL